MCSYTILISQRCYTDVKSEICCASEERKYALFFSVKLFADVTKSPTYWFPIFYIKDGKW